MPCRSGCPLPPLPADGISVDSRADVGDPQFAQLPRPAIPDVNRRTFGVQASDQRKPRMAHQPLQPKPRYQPGRTPLSQQQPPQHRTFAEAPHFASHAPGVWRTHLAADTAELKHQGRDGAQTAVIIPRPRTPSRMAGAEPASTSRTATLAACTPAHIPAVRRGERLHAGQDIDRADRGFWAPMVRWTRATVDSPKRSAYRTCQWRARFPSVLGGAARGAVVSRTRRRDRRRLCPSPSCRPGSQSGCANPRARRCLASLRDNSFRPSP
jgi:hypothetical protein